MSGVDTMRSVRFNGSSTRRCHETDGSIARTADGEVRGALFAATGARADTRAGSGDRAQVKCFDSKIMAQSFVLTENSFRFSDQKNVCALYKPDAGGKVDKENLTQVGRCIQNWTSIPQILFPKPQNTTTNKNHRVVRPEKRSRGQTE
jgi:hypothetical protein